MHQGKNAAGQRGDGQQLNHAHQRKTDRQCDQQLDIAAANPAPLVYDYQQQEQDCRGEQRFGNVHRIGK
jgi:hypothetical protein